MSRWGDVARWLGTEAHGGPMSGHRGVVLHIAEGYFDGTISWQMNPANESSSHFIVGRDGRTVQMIDTDLRSWCQRDGNAEWLSVEFEGFTIGHRLHRPGWELLTPAAVESAARLLARAHKQYGVPFALATGPASTGLGYHSMGGTAWGHLACPGSPIIGQRGDVLARARAIAGVPDTTPPPHPAVADWTRRIIVALPTLSRGATGQDVKRAQGLLLAANKTVTVDGVYGPKTYSAVIAFQHAERLTADGITGRQTWSALLGEKL